jgi:hypothetical protein
MTPKPQAISAQPESETFPSNCQLTCQFCSRAPASHLLLADSRYATGVPGRKPHLVCAGCAHHNLDHAKDIAATPSSVWLFRLTPDDCGAVGRKDHPMSVKLPPHVQYGIRWPTESVFAFPSREAAEEALAEMGGAGVLVACEYEPDTPNATPWHEVED